MFASPYSNDSYLLRKERRYRWRDGAGRIDLDALARTAKLLPTAPEFTAKQRDQLGRVLDRVQKSAAAYPELAAQGMIDERFGFPIVVEVPEGGMRRGVSDDGAIWETMFTGGSYGFLPETISRDAEEIDTITGPNADAPNVFVIAFLKPSRDDIASDGAVLDEHKLFIGFNDYEAAQACARANWPPERIGGITVVPLEVIRGLLNFEMEEGMLCKSLRLMASDGVVAIGQDGVIIGRVTKAQQPSATLAPVHKSATSLATFAGGGLLLPGQGKLRLLSGKVCDAVQAKAGRCAKALDSLTAYLGHTRPLDDFPELEDHPAKSLPFTELYDNPADVGGWLGVIEPVDESWICFVDVNGRALLWLEREAEGGVIGEPIEFRRPDLIPQTVPVDVLNSQDELVAKTIATVKLCAIAKGLDASTPIDRRIVYGVALEPEPFDGKGDAHDETYDDGVIRRAAYGWLGNFANFDDSHGRFFSKQEIIPVESFIAPVDYVWEGSSIKRGSWVVAAKIVSDVLWARILAGELNAWSIEGFAVRECTACDSRMKKKVTPNGDLWLCPSCDKLALLMP